MEKGCVAIKFIRTLRARRWKFSPLMLLHGKQFGGLIITENGRDTACHSPDALRFSQVDRRWKFTAVGNAAGEQQGMRFGPQLDRRLFFNNVTGGWNVKWSRLVPKAGRIWPERRVRLFKRTSVHHESAESAVRNSGRAVGVEPEQQKLSGPDRWQLSLLGGEVQGAEQAARPSQSCVRWCGPDGHPAAQFLTQQNRVPVSTAGFTPLSTPPT